MRTLPVFFALVLVPLQGQVPEVRTTAKDRTALSVTIYQSGLAAIRDTRRVSLPAGPSRLAFADLVPTLRPKSATLLDPGGGLQVRERNYEFNLLSPATLVDASLGLPVRIKGEEGQPDQAGTLASVPLLNPRMRPDAKPLERIAKKPSAYVQSPDPEVVVTTSEGIRSWMPGDLALTQVPPHLRTSPTLLQDLVAPAAGKRDLTLLYTATDLTWEANYVATLASDGKHLDLDVFATVKNQSGARIADTTLQLLAGEPNLVYDPLPSDRSTTSADYTTVEVMASASSPPVFKEEKLSEFPLFTLDRPVTLAARADKQLSLMNARGIPIQKKFLVEAPYHDYGHSPSSFLASSLFKPEPPTIGYGPVPINWRTRQSEEETAGAIPDSLQTHLEHSLWMDCHYPPVLITGSWMNSASVGLGRALPKGPFLLRYQDPSGSLVLPPGSLASDQLLPQTPPGEDIEVILGRARGLQVTRQGVSHRVIPAKPFKDENGKIHPQRRYEYAVRVQVTNFLPAETRITVREPITSGWRLVSSSHTGKRSGSDAYDFQVRIPAHGRAALRYVVRTDTERWALE
ncbi:MAG: DUF4139 domain-containing protein [Geothrix sp.]|nr:DUF4139 domain-containing protein [Geothrix sp.]